MTDRCTHGPIRIALALALTLAAPVPAQARHPLPGKEGTPNIHAPDHRSHRLPARDRRRYRTGAESTLRLLLTRPLPAVRVRHYCLKDLGKEQAQVLYSWTIDNPDLHFGLGALRGRYFKTHGRYYYVQCFQFAQGGPDADLGAIVFDVTGLPDTSTIKEVAQSVCPTRPVGFTISTRTSTQMAACCSSRPSPGRTPRSSTWTSCWQGHSIRGWSVGS